MKIDKYLLKTESGFCQWKFFHGSIAFVLSLLYGSIESCVSVTNCFTKGLLLKIIIDKFF